MMRQVLVILPGIGGSVLADATGEPVWGNSRRTVVGALRHPERLSLSEELRAVDVVASAGFVAPFRLHGYDVLIKRLVNVLRRSGIHDVQVDVVGDACRPVPGAQILVVPYDFRRGVAVAAAEVRAKVHSRLNGGSTGDWRRRLVVVGHSMGGLVARHWLSDPSEANLCLALLTLGTPYRGASRALDWLANGVRFGRGPVRTASAALLDGTTAVLREWPATYDLLPTYEVIHGRDGATMKPHDLTPDLVSGFAGTTAFRNAATAAATRSEEVTRAWSAVEPGTGPGVLPFFARDHGTPHLTHVEDGQVYVSWDDPAWQPNAGWRGDGTVPALSALPPELAEEPLRWYPLRHRHTPMLGADGVLGVVRNLIGDTLAEVRGAEP